MTALRDHREDVRCACPRIEALECYDKRHGIGLDNPRDPGDDNACECECHRRREEEEQDADDAAV